MKEDIKKGSLHPITTTIRKLNDIFFDMGFEIVLGPELEFEYYNFDALNVPEKHPARDMQDTFWIDLEKKTLMRTQTSSVQVRHMEKNEPPFRIIVPGRVFRNEATDATHDFQFYQTEGLMIDKDVSMSNLVGVLKSVFEEFFGTKLSTRLRPGYFPFVEPGVEIDVSCFNCGGNGCGVCKNTGWIEILGAGMVHRTVLENGGINPRRWRGMAFGFGIDRILMLKYGIEDIRLLYSGDLRFVNQF